MTTKIPAALCDSDVPTTASVAAAAAAANVKLTGDIVQRVTTVTGAVATGTTLIPGDNTIPQNTEGDQYMTLAITPTSAANYLDIEVVWNGTSSVSSHIGVALFQDSTANALAATYVAVSGGGFAQNACFKYRMTAGTTSATTFKVRAGGNTAGTVTFNGVGGAQIFGGVMASSITITEIKA